MLKNYLKIALRNLRRQKLYAAINVFGLAVGIACCLLIFMLVRHEWTFDRFHEQADRIYRLVIEEVAPGGDLVYHGLIPPSTAPAIQEALPGIEAVTRFVQGQRIVRLGNEVNAEMLTMVDSTFFDIFSFPLKAGDPATALDDPQSVVVSEDIARKYFGAADESVLGQTLIIERGEEAHPFNVTGVLEPIPVRSSIQIDVLLPFRQYEIIPIGSNDWGGRASLYLLLDPGQNPEQLAAALPSFTKVEFAQRIEDRRLGGYLADQDDAFRLILQPLSELHLDPEKDVRYEVTPHDRRYSYVLGGIALLVLALACINFMILSVGRSTGRAREVGVRKVLGADRTGLMRQFWGEALVTTTLALILGLLLVELALPTFNRLTGKELAFAQLISPASLVAMILLVLLVGFVAGIYPAAVLSRFQPASVLKGQLGVRRRSLFNRTLIVVQYTMSIGLIIATMTMYRQLDYLLNKDLGFDSEQVLVLHTPQLTTEQEDRAIERYRNSLEGQHGITNVVKTAYAFTRAYDTFGWTAADGKWFKAHNIGVDYDYIDVMGMELVAGRNFDRERARDSSNVIVNEAFVREYEIEDPIGHVLTGLEDSFFGTNPTIIGVVKDFNFRSLHEQVEPAMLNIHPDYYMGMNAILFKVQPGNPSAAISNIEQTWKDLFPRRPFSYSFLDEDMAAQYEAEQRWSRILTYSALLAILIACLGLFGLATLSVVRRTKEIGIRKILGASVSGITLLVTREFIVLVGIATVVAWPVAFFAMRGWLENFAYRISMPWWIFAAAGLLALSVSVITVSYHAFRAARVDPAKSLRYE